MAATEGRGIVPGTSRRDADLDGSANFAGSGGSSPARAAGTLTSTGQRTSQGPGVAPRLSCREADLRPVNTAAQPGFQGVAPWGK
jgi:hypothetical protein